MSGLFGKSKGEQVTVKIEGMSCQHCVGKVDKGLASLDGVLSAEVSLERNEAVVRYDPEKVDVEGIRNKITEVGYQVL